MKRGRIQLGLILGLLLVGVVASALTAVFTPSAKHRGAGIAYAEGEEGGSSGGAMPTPGGQPAEAEEGSGGAPTGATNDESDLTKRIRQQEHGPDVYDKHADATPQQLRSFETLENGQPIPGIRYAGSESAVAQTTEKIRTLDIAAAAEKKYALAEEMLSEDNGRKDPLEITDSVPEELRLLYAGEDDLSALSDAELEQLFLSGIRTELAYLPIDVIGVIDNGVTRMALISFYGGRGQAVPIGASFNLGRFPIDPNNPRRAMTLTMTVTEIREDYVEMRIDISYTLLNGSTETLEPVMRRFYLHTVF